MTRRPRETRAGKVYILSPREYGRLRQQDSAKDKEWAVFLFGVSFLAWAVWLLGRELMK